MTKTPTHESQVSRTCPTCGKHIPEEAAMHVIMACANCFVCCKHTHVTVLRPGLEVRVDIPHRASDQELLQAVEMVNGVRVKR